jgi:hypothetical protein
VVVFRQPGSATPTTPLLFRGQPLQLVESCRYLGVTLHATKGFAARCTYVCICSCHVLVGWVQAELLPPSEGC